MAVIEIIFAVIGLLTVIVLALTWHVDPESEPSVNDDLSVPYREGLHAAMRIQTVAQELEQELYAEAMRRGASGTTDTGRFTSTSGASVNYEGGQQ
jgi:hypothetical protein